MDSLLKQGCEESLLLLNGIKIFPEKKLRQKITSSINQFLIALKGTNTNTSLLSSSFSDINDGLSAFHR